MARTPRRLRAELALLALLFAAIIPVLLLEAKPLEARRVAREFVLRAPEVRGLLGEDVRTRWRLRDLRIGVQIGQAIESEQAFALVGARGAARARVRLCRTARDADWRVQSAHIEPAGATRALELAGESC